MRVRLRNPDRVADVTGPAPVRRVLEQLEVNPETVLVIHEGTLVTREHVLPDDAEVEVRPVISGGAGGRGGRPQRCTTRTGPASGDRGGPGRACGEAAVVEIARHRAAYCAEHFLDHVRAQVRSAVDRHRMMSYDDRILVAVSGGKDSLALWDVLTDMGYRADGLYLGLGIGGYSDRSERVVRGFAERRGLVLHCRDLAAEYGFDIPRAAQDRGRSSCGVCGLSKRYVFNRAALEGGYDVMATGHNLDDEAATLLANVLRWQTPFMARQSVCLPAGDGGPSGTPLAKKVKPLYRLGERETAAYCVLKGLDYVVEECPMVGGNTVLRYKDALNTLEEHSPGTKAHFLFGFLDRVQHEHFGAADGQAGGVVRCRECGMPTTARCGEGAGRASGEAVCAFCRARERVLRVVRQDGPRAGRPQPSGVPVR